MRVTFSMSDILAISLEPETRFDEVLQSLHILIMTPAGSVPCYREFGIDYSFKDKPVPVAKTMFASAIADGIEAFLPGVTLESITFSDDADHPDVLHPVLEVTVDEQD